MSIVNGNAPAIQALRPISRLNTPFPNITPFTVRDNATYLMELEDIKRWLWHDLTPHVNEGFQSLVNGWKEAVQELINAVEDNITKNNAAVEKMIADQLAEFKAIKDAIIGSSIELQDEVLQAIFSDPTSEFRVLIDGLYANKETQTEVETRLSDETLRENFARRERKIINVKDFGAVGDGVTDDSDAIQRAFDSAVDGSVEWILPGIHKLSKPVTIVNTQDWRLTGPGGLLDNKLVIGKSAGPAVNHFWFIDGVKFLYSTQHAPDTVSIELLITRRGNINGCHFDGAEKAISVAPLATAVFHGTAQIKVVGNEFERVGWALYVDRVDGITWMHASDFKFIANTVNWARYQHIYCKSIDGIVISDNVLFMRSYDTKDDLKRQNIWIGESDWIIISGNNAFEAGHESVYLENPRHFAITGNLFAWPGQRDLYSAINLQGGTKANGVICGNVMSLFSLHGVQVGPSLTGSIRTTDNVFEFSPDPRNTYYGTELMSSVNHYGVQSGNNKVKLKNSGNDLGGNLFNTVYGGIRERVEILPDQGVSALRTAVNVTGPNTPVAILESSRSLQSIYSGLVMVEVRNNSASDLAETGNSATYLLMVSKSALGGHIVEIAKQGLTAGNAANWPSLAFSFDATTNQLRASPVNATNGSFYFYVTVFGGAQARIV